MKGEWTIEKIKEGFDRFLLENGRLPIAPEIDSLDYLPSSRQIQRKFGGLEKLRTIIGYTDTHFGRGSFRREISNKTGVKGRSTEIELEKILKEKFGEVFVHTEKIFEDLKYRVDFYVYSPDGNFGVDVFYTETMRDLQKNINIKINKYQKFPCQLFLVVGNDEFKQESLNEYMANKRKSLPQNTTIFAFQSLIDFIKTKNNYPNPLNSLK
jgi:hypothetical protein